MFPSQKAGRYRRRWKAEPRSRRGQLVIFHGTHEHSGRYNAFAEACVTLGVEVCALDFHGHGLSEGTPGDIGTADSVVKDAVDFVMEVTAPDQGQPPMPTALFGHSLGAMVTFLAAHELAARGCAPACVVLSGFAMDSESPPLGIHSLTPLLRVWDGQLVRAVMTALCRLSPLMDATPLDCSLVTNDEEQLRRMHEDPLHFKGWIRNRTALTLLVLRARCRALLSQWGRDFAFMLVHGAEDRVCPRSAVDKLMAAAPQPDKHCVIYDGALHETLFAEPATCERVTMDILRFVTVRFDGARGSPPRSRL